MACQEDLRNSEARWGATLSRYRMRIRSLEADNLELKEDLRMMEQERLRSWQIQVECMHFVGISLLLFVCLSVWLDVLGRTRGYSKEEVHGTHR